MSDPQDAATEPEWKTVGQAPAPRPGGSATPTDFDGPPPDEKIYGRREPTPPGKISLRVGAVAFLAMAALYIFADLREVSTTWPDRRVFSLVYALSLIPAFGVLWGIIGLVTRHPGDAGRAAAGLVLSLGALGLAYGVVASKPPRQETAPAISNDRVKLPPKDLTKWREEKLRREKK